MKKLFKYLMLFVCTFAIFGCGCKKDETISKETAIEVLKETRVNNNVEITTTTETNVNGVSTTSTQTDVYYGNKYYHLSENNGISTKTWYGHVDNVLYAFYYTKNANSEEVKTSSRIEDNQLESAKKQPNNIITSLFDEEGNLLANYEVTGSKNGRTYTIQITNNTEQESDVYTITITDNKIIKVVKNSSIASDSIKTTYDYNYDVEDIDLPTLNEYPLQVNG